MLFFRSLARGIVICALFALSTFCYQPDAFADGSSASLSVAVTDTTGAFVPKATLILRNLATGQEQKSESGNSGTATFPFLKPGRYQLTASKDSFADVVVDNIMLNVGDDRRLQLSLKVGSATQTVTVDASGLSINTTDASVSTVVDRRFVENIPLNGRSFQSLILLTPGVVTNSPQSSGASGYAGEFSVNGQRTEANSYQVDGVSANTGGYVLGYGTAGTSGSLPAASALGTTQSLLSADALQEFRVASSTYSAEFGLSPGGQFSFSSRSGTNQFHGTIFDYLRNNYFDANDWFNNNLGKPTTPLRQNDFGGTAGGPIVIPHFYRGMNRSFFFFSFEGLRLMQPQAAFTYYVPSLSLRQSASAALQPVLRAFPTPSGTALANGLAPFIQTSSLPSDVDSISTRIDQQFTPRLKAFFRFGDTQSAKTTRTLSVLTSTTQSSYTNTFGLTTVLSDQIADEFRFNYTSNVGATTATLDNFGGAQAVDLFQLQGIGSKAAALVGLYFPGYTPSVSQQAVTQPQQVWNLVNSITITKNRQTIKLGGDYRSIKSFLQRTNPYVYSLFNSSTNVIANNSYSSNVTAYGPSYPAYSNTALYAQDELHATQRLSLSLGLRWEVNPPPTQAQGALPYIALGNISNPSSLVLAPRGTRFWKTTYYNFAPRVGLAYQAHDRPGRETVIRAGGGVFFDTGEQGSTQPFGQSPGQSATNTYVNVSYPLTPAQVAISITDPPVGPYYLTYYFPPHLQLPYNLEWNLAVEQALGKSQALTFTYVGSAGRRLLSQQLFSGLISNFSNIYAELSGTSSNYNALQLQLQRSLSHGFQMLASYNWAHSIDFGSQSVANSQIRGNSDFDVRHNVSLAMSYDISVPSTKKILRTFVSDWGVDTRFTARTGFPVILNGNQITIPGGGTSYGGLNLVPGVPLYIHVQGIPGNQRINPSAFSLPGTNQLGNAPRNFVRGFGMNQVDLAARRTFPLTEHLKLQFRAETFNLLNHPNFGFIQPTFGNVQFGEATKMLSQSLGGLSPLYQSGGPRSMQFALKAIF